MTENRLVDYLDHMQVAASRACTYVEGLSKEDFLADEKTQQAVILNIIVLGEAATKLLKVLLAINRGRTTSGAVPNLVSRS